MWGLCRSSGPSLFPLSEKRARHAFQESSLENHTRSGLFFLWGLLAGGHSCVSSLSLALEVPRNASGIPTHIPPIRNPQENSSFRLRGFHGGILPLDDDSGPAGWTRTSIYPSESLPISFKELLFYPTSFSSKVEG